MDTATFRPLAELPDPDDPPAFLRETLSFPDALAIELENLLGEEAIPAAEAFNRQAPTTLRVNTLRGPRRQVLSSLPGAIATRYSPWGIELPRRMNIHELTGFDEGRFEVQEEASQLTALLTDARPGQVLVDIGAGAGGKTLSIAGMMRNRGTLACVDVASQRLAELERRATRAGVKIADPFLIAADLDGRWQLSGSDQRNVDSLREKADCVLVDAPCSGTGVMRRAPDAKWRKYDPTEFLDLQILLLEQSAALVARGGCLVYATCAFERTQNETVVKRFLASPAGQAFAITPALPRLESALLRAQPQAERPNSEAVRELLTPLMAGPFLRTWPHRHNLDAFFGACLLRTG